MGDVVKVFFTFFGFIYSDSLFRISDCSFGSNGVHCTQIINYDDHNKINTMKYKVQHTFDEETKEGILLAIDIAERASTEALIEHVRYSTDVDETVRLAQEVRKVRLAHSVLGYITLSYEIVEE